MQHMIFDFRNSRPFGLDLPELAISRLFKLLAYFTNWDLIYTF